MCNRMGYNWIMNLGLGLDLANSMCGCWLMNELGFEILSCFFSERFQRVSFNESDNVHIVLVKSEFIFDPIAAVGL